MGVWERHVVPRVMDRVCGAEELHERRAEVCRGLEGRVVELGFGSGLNVRHYPAAVTEVRAVEPNDVAWKLARRRIATGSTPVVRSGLDGQRLAEDDASCDDVLTTFVLCTIPDQRVALAEAYRVLRPGGELHFLEHGLAPEAGVQRWQHRLEPLQRRVAGGCHLTRRPVEDLEKAGFQVEVVVEGYLPGPRFSKPGSYVYRGVAVKPA